MSKKEVEAIYQLSSAQQGMLFATLTADTSGLYVEQSVCPARGELDLNTFREAWQAVVNRHGVLRTAFVWRERNEPLQVVLRQVTAPVEYRDLIDLASAAQEETIARFLVSDRRRGFKLNDPPLMRLTLFRLEEQRYQLVWSYHHMLMDGWCLATLLPEFLTFYEALGARRSALLDPPIPYRNYINWLKEQDEAGARTYWEKRMAGFNLPTLPGRAVQAGKNRPAGYGDKTVSMSPAESVALASLTRRHRLTLNVLVQGIWALLLGQYNEQNDVVFGNTLSGRSGNLPGIETMIGLFMNTLPLRLGMPEDEPFWAWLQTVQQQTLALQQFEHSSGALAHGSSALPHSLPLYETIVVFENYPAAAQTLSANGLVLDVGQARFLGGQTHYALTLLVVPEPALSFQAIYDRRRLDDDGARQLLTHVQRLLHVLLTEPEPTMAALRAQIPAAEIPLYHRSGQEERGARTGPVVWPRTALETLVADIWRQVLGIDEVSIHDNFFEFGGHSLLATELMNRLADAFQTTLPMRYLFDMPTVAGLAAALAEQTGEPANGGTALPLIEPDTRNRYEPFPLNEVQQAYWVGRSDLMELGNVACHGYMEFDCLDLNLPRLVRAWQYLVERHDMLRAIIQPDGQQRILPEVPPYEVSVQDLRGAPDGQVEAAIASLRAEMSHQVLPSDRWPLFDLRTLQLDEHHFRLHISIDMLIADARSFQVMLEELTLLYNDAEAELPELGLSFRDYVLAERALQETEMYATALAYWRERLPTLPPGPELPLVCNPETIRQPRFQRRSGRLPAPAWERLKERAARAGLTPSGLLLAAFAEVLATWSQNPHFTINLTLFNRLPLHPQVNAIMGDFTTLTLLEVDHEGSDPFVTRAQRLQKQLWQDLDHRYVSGIQVQRELARQRGGTARAAMPVVFTSTLVQGNQAGGFPDWLGEMVYGIGQTPQVWLDHVVSEEKDAAGGAVLVYNWDAVEALFPERMLDDMLAAYSQLLETLAREPERWQQARLPLLPAYQQAQREAINDTATAIPGELLHQPFVERARQHPERTALITPEQRLSYGELNRRATQLARYLRAEGAEPNRLVAIVMEKGWEQVVASLAILMSGAAYLPIDALLPQERVWHLLAHGEVQLALTQSRFLEQLAWPEGVRAFAVDDSRWQAFDAAPLEPVQQIEDLAYVVYTSGSTGSPKGVVIDHRGAHNTVADINRRFNVQAADRVLALSSLSFDLSVYDIFGLLSVGGAVVIPAADGGRDPAHWLALMRQEAVTVWNTVPALMAMLVEYVSGRHEELPAALRLVMMSGDWIPVNLPNRIRKLAPQRPDIISLGGATEASIWSILYPIGVVEPEWPSIPYGRPMDNQRFHVLDHTLSPCPTWVPGDLYIGGTGLALGYWRDAEKTAASFITHPDTGERLYHTGDMGRYLSSGEIEFLGREDFQVKVQGYRIELGEIETNLLQHPAVQAAAVTAVGEHHGDKRLIAYIVPVPGEAPATEALRDFLQRKLPVYMVPAVFIYLERLPLTDNGKVNRRALPAPGEVGVEMAEAAFVAPRSQTEAQLAALCCRILDLGAIGVHDNFFALGGNSIQATQLISALRETFAIELSIRAIFEAPSVALLAEKVDASLWADERVRRLARGSEERIEGTL